jgi:hypothetical protein
MAEKALSLHGKMVWRLEASEHALGRVSMRYDAERV